MCTKLKIQVRNFKFRTKTKFAMILMINLAISWLPLNTSLRIQDLQFTSALWPHTHTVRKKFRNFKHTIL